MTHVHMRFNGPCCLKCAEHEEAPRVVHLGVLMNPGCLISECALQWGTDAGSSAESYDRKCWLKVKGQGHV